jgi:hypothetical protein
MNGPSLRTGRLSPGESDKLLGIKPTGSFGAPCRKPDLAGLLTNERRQPLSARSVETIAEVINATPTMSGQTDLAM